VKGLQAEWGTCSRTVSLESTGWTLSCWNNTIALGSRAGEIIIFDGVTGSQTTVFSGHTLGIRSLVFQSDGKSVVSGSYDCDVKLWDMQTGGVIRTFNGHTHWVCSVSISADSTRIASASDDRTIRLWNIQTGECYCFINPQCPVYHVSFCPTNPQHLLSMSDFIAQQWDINGHPVPTTYNCTHVSFSQDGALSVPIILVQGPNSRAIVAKVHVINSDTRCCCLSPNGRLIAVAAGHTASVWDITDSDPHLVKTFVGHTKDINSLVFSSPSSLVSVSDDKSVKFWQIGDLSTDSVTTDLKSDPPTSAQIQSVSLQVKDGIAISSDSDGVVKTWDILTGLCKSSFQTPAKGTTYRDVQLINKRLILVWYKYNDKKICIWDTEKGELLQTVDVPKLRGLRISGDGTRVFYLSRRFIKTWSIWTGEPVGEVELKVQGKGPYLDPIYMDGSKIWVQSKGPSSHGWDFGISGSPPVQLPNMSTERPHLDFVGSTPWQTNSPSRIMDKTTGEVVFQLSGRYANPSKVQWDGQYLITGYKSGEVLILDFCDLHPQ